ncbi:hypothetical protein, partial [Klebsiella pneumoniae]|uniref:hypothetical protein n=1 Tax=Klebsiella pneumoniae TaxID=573 RepID=UPI001C8F8BD4
INRYMKQLKFCGPVIKDYLVDTIENQPNAPLIYGPIDTSIYNRIPQEVHLYRKINDFSKYIHELDSSDLIQEEREKPEDEKEPIGEHNPTLDATTSADQM